MFEDANMTLLQKMLDAATVRHKTIANNLANANTPGYQRRVVDFDQHLAEAIRSGDAAQLEAVKATVVKSGDPALRADGSNVSLEREMADLMKNSLVFNALTQLLSARISGYRAAITGDTRTS